MRSIIFLAFFVCCESVVAASTFIGQTTANFRVTERLDGTTTTANKTGTFNVSLTTDFSTMRWSLDFDVDLLMAGGPSQSFETRLAAHGSFNSRRCASGCGFDVDNPSPLSFPDANGRSGAGSYYQYGIAGWTLTDRIGSVLRERTSSDKAAIGSGRYAGAGANTTGSHFLSVLNYPSSIELTTGMSGWSSGQNQTGQWFDLQNTSLALGRISDGSNYLEVAVTGFPGSITLTEMVPGDFTDSGMVDAADYVLWRKSPGLLAPFLTNYSVWSNNFGAGAASGTGSNVPEPSTVVILGVILSSSMAFRRIHGNRSASVR